ncbi:hypothetical protein KC19_7G140000 [Ceratodon purpureus]|uniref:Uncharacterized protein n=1 Tax=Ceratodon purpureus TaxID=3225 RepID=A0A8T0HEP9_CERPU|nr:hypothetical protein KC19_7G140000 [Ceratodon purpureus]
MDLIWWFRGKCINRHLSKKCAARMSLRLSDRSDRLPHAESNGTEHQYRTVPDVRIQWRRIGVVNLHLKVQDVNTTGSTGYEEGKNGYDFIFFKLRVSQLPEGVSQATAAEK